MTHVHRSIELAWISSMQDMGDFSEGFCFKIKTFQMGVYTLCADNISMKT